jgi:hypothetical protein
MKSKAPINECLQFATTKALKTLSIGETKAFLVNPRYPLNNNVYIVAKNYSYNLSVNRVIAINSRLESQDVLLVTRIG